MSELYEHYIAGSYYTKEQNKNTFKIKSLMAENGVIFSDGVESDFINFNSGAEVTISVSEKRGLLVV